MSGAGFVVVVVVVEIGANGETALCEPISGI